MRRVYVWVIACLVICALWAGGSVAETQGADNPRKVTLRVLAEECGKNHLRFFRQWKNKTFIVKGTVSKIDEGAYGEGFRKYEGEYLKMETPFELVMTGVEYLAAYFVFPSYLSDPDNVNIGDNIEVEGTLSDRTDFGGLIFTNCLIRGY